MKDRAFVSRLSAPAAVLGGGSDGTSPHPLDRKGDFSRDLRLLQPGDLHATILRLAGIDQHDSSIPTTAAGKP